MVRGEPETTPCKPQSQLQAWLDSGEGVDMENICNWFVTRGGFSSGGGYDRMNFTRQEPCGRDTNGARYCPRHLKAKDKSNEDTRRLSDNRATIVANHENHSGNEHAYSKDCHKCGTVIK